MNQTDFKDKWDRLTVVDTCSYSNDIQMIDILLSLYSFLHKDKDSKLKPAEQLILNYYIRLGISTKTKKRILADTGKKMVNINTTTHTLRTKGYIIKKHPESTKYLIHPDIMEKVEAFLNNGKHILAIGFTREKLI